MLDQLRERLAVDHLHGVEMHTPFRAHGVDGHDVGVVQLGGSLRFVLEALQMLGVERCGEGQDLDRYAASERQLDRLVDDSHAPPADFAHNAKIAQRQRAVLGVGVCGGGFADGRLHRFRFAHVGRRGMHQLQPFETLGQVAGNVAVPGQELRAIERAAGLDGRQIFLGGGDDARIVDIDAVVRGRRVPSWLPAAR